MRVLPFEQGIDKDSLEEIENLVRQWRTLFPKNDQMRIAQESYDEDFLVRMAYNSNAIEGSTLTLADTEIVYEGEFVPGKPGREQIAARGLFEGAAFVKALIEDGMPLDEEHLRDLHECCALDLQPSARGMYRSAPAIIRASRTTPASPLKIREEMANLFYQAHVLFEEKVPLAVIPWFHASFENIHPFADGNGRVGRLWMNAQLQKWAYPPICIKVDHGAEYKAALEAWQVEAYPEPFMKLFFGFLKDELEKRIAFLSQDVSCKADFSQVKNGIEVLGVLYYQPSVTASSLGKILGLSERQVQRILKALSSEGHIKRVGSARKGAWVIIDRR